MNHLSKEINSHDELEQVVAKDKNIISDNNRFKLLEFTTNKTIRQGLWCIVYPIVVLKSINLL